MPSKPPLFLVADAPLEITAAADGSKTPRVAGVVYSGGVMRLPGWGNVLVDVKGVVIANPIPLLANHGEGLDQIVGQAAATVANNTIGITGTLSAATDSGAKVIALARDGIALQASIGMAPDRTEQVAPGQTVNVNGQNFVAPPSGLTVTRSGQLREISLVSTGADPNTNITIAAKAERRPMSTDNQHNAYSEENMRLAATAGEGLDLPERLEFVFRQAGKWSNPGEGPHQRAESAKLACACGKIPFEDFRATLWQEKCRDAEIALIHASYPKGPGIRSSGHEVGGPATIQAALLCHLGQEPLAVKHLGEQAVDAGRRLRCTHVLDVFKAALTDAGQDVPAGKDAVIKAAFSTTNLPVMLGDAANKISLAAYLGFPSVARIIARKLSSNDFKATHGVRLVGNSGFEEVGPAGEIKHGNLTENTFSYRVRTYAKMFGLTRQEIINDDLNNFAEVPNILGRASAATLEAEFWKLVLLNTGSFFSGGNLNYISGSTTNLSEASLTTAVQTFRQMVDENGEPLSIAPKYLVCPPELEVTADKLFASTNVIATGVGASAATTPSGNPFAGKYQPLVVPHLSNATYSGYSATGWYLFGSPTDVASFGIAYLNNQESPTIESADSDFNTLGLQWRGYLDFGVAQIDKRGAVISKGAA